jgi:hypothetical protein
MLDGGSRCGPQRLNGVVGAAATDKLGQPTMFSAPRLLRRANAEELVVALASEHRQQYEAPVLRHLLSRQEEPFAIRSTIPATRG